MSSLVNLGVRPPQVTADPHFGPWFAALAGRLLNGVDFLVAGEPYRFAELEAYYFGEGHPDPFTHRDPVQFHSGRWYFHRTAGEYRGGSFKGVDLTFGDGTAMFGMLVRTVVAPDGTVIDGPSLTVDHLLARTTAGGVAALDAMIAGRPAWDPASPLAIRETATPRTAAVLRTARVGLSLKRTGGKPDAPRYVMRPYRFLTEPRRITKGRLQMVLALHQQGKDAAAIMELTGVPKKALDRYVAAFAAGKTEPGFAGYVGKDLGPIDLCRLTGTWAATFGATDPEGTSAP
ncbi:MAG: hypothetical protein JWO38_4746 [Gemmataceae bacterium]|nr:hypothetical protein [Gemmataceae bacterium]